MTLSAFFIFQIVVLIFSVMIHEIAHGYVAERLGDPTARLAGRLTLNPIAHIDLFGSILLPLVLFLTRSPIVLGWAKPVPYNPANLSKDYKYGPLKVALAGPISNLILLLVFGLLARFGVGVFNPILIAFFSFIAYLNVFLAIFNLVPIPPLDGSKILPIFFPNMNVERIGFMGILLVFLFLYFFSSWISILAGWILSAIVGPKAFYLMFQVIQSFV